MVGEERAALIRDCPENFADADAFRIYHAKSRFRATFTTLGATMVASSVGAQMLGFRSGTQLISRYNFIAVPAIIGTWVVSYQVWNRIVGFTPQKWNEFTYAKNLRMLRNI